MESLASNPLVIGAAALVLVPVAVLVVLSVIYNKKAEPGAPPVWTGGYPIITHFLDFSKNPVETIKKGYMANGPVFTLKFLGNNLTFLIGPEAQTPFFKARDEELSQNEPYKFMTPIFGKGVVFDAPLDIKSQQLKFVAGALRPDALRTYVGKIVRETEDYLKSWPASGEVDLLDEMAKLTILTASACLLGPEVRQHMFGEVSQLLHELDEGISPIAIFYPNAPLPSFKKRDAARAKIGEIFSAVIRARRESGRRYEDMLQAFMEAEYKDGSRCNDYQITGLLLGVLFAGQHTSSITSTWTLLKLLFAPALMDRAMEEQTRELGSEATSTATFNFDSVARLDFLHRCMKESIRQAPPLIMLMRKVHEPFKAGGYTIPRDHLVFASPAVAMNLPNETPECAFKDPEVFDPDRYVPPRAEDKAMPGLLPYCAFGAGPHACLGENFGYLQVKTIVSMLLRQFEFEPVADRLPEPNYRAMVVGPTQPTRVRFRRRTAPLPAGKPAAAAANAAAAKAFADAKAAATAARTQ